MAHLLVLYGTSEGQTQKIAAFIADRLRKNGHTVEVDAVEAIQSPLDAERIDGVIVGASVHAGRHKDTVVQFVRDNRAVLDALPSAFFSVSLAVLDELPHKEARTYVARFLQETGWTPNVVETIAGALRYTQYGFVKRFIMKQISKRSGRPTDTSRDFEFTDWTQVSAFVDRVQALLGVSQAEDVGGRIENADLKNAANGPNAAN
jgi:menaquinone-dependent protoporphyrinogen oxidase